MRILTSNVVRGSVALLCAASALACSGDFDTARRVAPRGSLGRELYAVVCDRVGAQALREDVTGASFHAVCHADPVTGAYAAKVDATQLPPLDPDGITPEGVPVSLAQQQANRVRRIARVEALGRRREELVAALDAAIPDIRIARLAPTDGAKSCDAPADPNARDVGLHEELAHTLSRLVDLYDDDTIPNVTRAVGHLLDDLKADADAQQALARFDARQGYRPMKVALGAIRPIVAYPRLVELVRSLLDLFVAPDSAPSTDATRAFDELLRVGYEELRTPDATPTTRPPLLGLPDPVVGRALLQRPRTLLEAAREVMTTDADAFATPGPPELIVRRDPRGYALVPTIAGAVPLPFVDHTGPAGAPDGLPDIDDLGRFVTAGGAQVPTPFFSVDGPDGARDALGEAKLATGQPMYGYLDTRRTFLAALARDLEPLFAAGPKEKEAVMNLLGGVPVLAGTRDLGEAASATYPPDPHEIDAWRAAHGGAPTPPGLGTTPVVHRYRAFHPEDAPLVDLTYALGQVLATPEIDDLLALAQTLFADHPNAMASLMGLALEVRATAQKHPEATLPDDSTLWDDVFVQLARVAHEPGLLEDILRGFADPKSLPMERVLATFVENKDDVSYDPANLNGPSKNMSSGTAPPNFVTPVDRTQPDVGTNRSELQKFLSLLHDTNGLAICTKDGAIVHIKAQLPNTSIPIDFDYPTDRFYSPLVCGLVGSSAPDHLPQCAVFGYTNVMSLLLDVLLGHAQLTVRDPCLSKLMASPLATFAGGADHFLEMISGVDGFSLHPNLRGFARLLYFQTPYPGLPTDPNGATTNQKTSNFLRDTIDPIPSMVCPVKPFTAADGTVYPLRSCATVNDTLRARDPDALFPVDELGFVQSLQPLALAFDKHKKPLYFADLFDVLHLHWGSKAQPPDVCDPTLPRTDARWCSQDGLVKYEPLLGEILRHGVFQRLQGFLNTAAGISVKHCDAWDPKTHLCAQSHPLDGVHVIAQALELLFDPTRTPGLVDRDGNSLALRNDGQRTDPVSAMDLLVNAFKGIDDAFAAYAAAHPSDAHRQDLWRAARSQIADTFLAVDGAGDNASFHDPTLPAIVPKVVGLLREQVAAHCTPGQPCPWASHDMPTAVADTIRGPLFAAGVDVLEAMRRDDTARAETERLLTYLVDATSGNDAQAGVLAATIDLLQYLEDSTNLTPFERIVARAVQPSARDDQGKVVDPGLADALVRSMVRIFERAPSAAADGSACVRERDPNRALSAVLHALVTPTGDDRPAPIEVIGSVIADVNRVDPAQTTKFDGHDFGNVANEMSEFCLDGTRGLEQLYAVIHQATHP